MSESIEETVMQNVYVLNGIKYLPHYKEWGVYVGPGSKPIPAYELRLAGAELTTHPLWRRAGS